MLMSVKLKGLDLVPIFFGSPLGNVIVPSFFIVGYVQQILERETFSTPIIGEQP